MWKHSTNNIVEKKTVVARRKIKMATLEYSTWDYNQYQKEEVVQICHYCNIPK